MEESVPSGENVFTEAPSVFPLGGGSRPFVTSSLHPSAFQQFLACSSPVFVEPSQWEVGSRHILYSPVDWSEHFICSGTDFGLVKQTHISVYFCCTLVCLGVFLCERTLWPARCYSTRSHSSFPSLLMKFLILLHIWHILTVISVIFNLFFRNGLGIVFWQWMISLRVLSKKLLSL